MGTNPEYFRHRDHGGCTEFTEGFLRVPRMALYSLVTIFSDRRWPSAACGLLRRKLFNDPNCSAFARDGVRGHSRPP